MLKIGLIAAGWHALAHHAPALRHFASHPQFHGKLELAGVFDADGAKASAAAEQFGFRRVYDSLEAIAGDVDAVVSILPAAALLSSLEPIVRHRRPVLIEKPLGGSLAEARQLAQRLATHPHMVSLNRRFDPGVQLARRWMNGRPPPRAVHGLMSRHNRHESDFVWSTGVHLSDLMCYLVGPLKVVSAALVPENGRIGLLQHDALHGTIQYLPIAGRVEEMVQIAGESWSVQIVTGTHQPWRVQCWQDGRLELDQSSDPQTPEFIRNGTADETAAFLRALLENRPLPGPGVDDAMPGTELAAALQHIAG